MTMPDLVGRVNAALEAQRRVGMQSVGARLPRHLVGRPESRFEEDPRGPLGHGRRQSAHDSGEANGAASVPILWGGVAEGTSRT